MAETPKYSETPLELLTNKCVTEPPAYLKWFGGALLGTMGFVGICTANWVSRRPAMAGIQKHIVFSAAGFVLGQTIEGWRDDYFAEKDAVFRHYVQLHPEDFPPYERKKFSEILLPWPPIR